MNHDDIDFDKLFDEELPFKPLTEGLGFHHQAKDKESGFGTLKSRSRELEKSFLNRSSGHLSSKERSTAGVVPERDMGDLAPFYGVEIKKEVEPNISIQEQAPAFETAVERPNGALRLVAFVMDLAIVVCALAVTFLSILVSSGISLIVIRENMSPNFLATYVLPISLLFFFFYFSFFDKTLFSTPGKKLMGLRVVSDKGEGIKMSQSFMRSLIVALSVFTAGMIGFLDFQGKITDTKVVKR